MDSCKGRGNRDHRRCAGARPKDGGDSPAGQGANLALVDIDHAKLADDGTALRESFELEVKDYPAHGDLTSRQSRACSGASTRTSAGVDGLINNAGITSDALLVKATDGKVQTKMSLTDFHKVIAVDLKGAFPSAREAAVHMVESARGGVIINISSIPR